MKRGLLTVISLLILLRVAPASAQQTAGPLTRNLPSQGACAVLPVKGMGTASVQIEDIAGSATVTWAVSSTGINYRPIDAAEPDAPATAANNSTTNGIWTMSVASLNYVRACIGASGTAKVTLAAAGTGGGGGGGGGGGAASTITDLEDGAGESVGDDANDAIRVNVVAGATAGTQYTEGDTDATITGNALLFESNTGTNALSVPSASAPLPVTAVITSTNIDVQSGGADLALETTLQGVLTTSAFSTVMGSGALALATQADNVANTSDGLQTTTFNYVFDGSTWDRWTGAVTVSTMPADATELPAAAALADNTANPTIPAVAAFQMCFDGTTWDRCTGAGADTELPAAAALADNTANPTVPAVASFNMCWDGSTWDRCLVATTTEATHNGALTADSTVGGIGMGIAKDQDGAALPNAVSAEGDAVIPALSLSGVGYFMPVTEDGSATALIRVHDGTDVALVTATAGGALQVECVGGTCSSTGSTPYDHGEAITLGTANGLLGMGRVSAAAPSTTGVVDDDAVALWSRNTGELVVGGSGAAGTAASGVVTVQGIASMTPMLVNPGTATQFGVYVEDGAETAAGNLMMAGAVRRDTAASSSTTAGDNSTINTDAIGLLWTRQLDPCSGVAKVSVPIDIVTATTTEIIDASASNFAYICAITLFSAGTNNVTLVEDDTDACASPTAGIAGGVTAAEGWNLTAQTGLAHGGGGHFVMKSAAANRNICLITSAAVQLNGTVVYALAP